MTFIVATTSLPVNRLNADRLERRTLVPIPTFTTRQSTNETNLSITKADPSLA